MSGARILIAAGTVYAAIAIATFGHSAAFNDDWREQNCATVVQRNERLSDCISQPWGPGLVAAILWPLYWSWELQA